MAQLDADTIRATISDVVRQKLSHGLVACNTDAFNQVSDAMTDLEGRLIALLNAPAPTVAPSQPAPQE